MIELNIAMRSMSNVQDAGKPDWNQRLYTKIQFVFFLPVVFFFEFLNPDPLSCKIQNQSETLLSNKYGNH